MFQFVDNTFKIGLTNKSKTPSYGPAPGIIPYNEVSPIALGAAQSCDIEVSV